MEKFLKLLNERKNRDMVINILKENKGHVYYQVEECPLELVGDKKIILEILKLDAFKDIKIEDLDLSPYLCNNSETFLKEFRNTTEYSYNEGKTLIEAYPELQEFIFPGYFLVGEINSLLDLCYNYEVLSPDDFPIETSQTRT